MENLHDKSKKLPSKKEVKSGSYTLYNTLAGKAEVKSISQSMHEFIKDGFEKLHAGKR